MEVRFTNYFCGSWQGTRAQRKLSMETLCGSNQPLTLPPSVLYILLGMPEALCNESNKASPWPGDSQVLEESIIKPLYHLPPPLIRIILLPIKIKLVANIYRVRTKYQRIEPFIYICINSFILTTNGGRWVQELGWGRGVKGKFPSDEQSFEK